MLSRTKRFYRFMREIFVDRYSCIGCDEELFEQDGSGLCDTCKAKLTPITSLRCSRCGRAIANESEYCITCMNNQRHFDYARECYVYEGLACELVHGLKFGGKRYYSYYMAHALVDKYLDEDMMCDIVVPAPMHVNVRKKRRFNHAALLAEEFADRLKLEYCETAIIKAIDNKEQARLGGKERESNALGAYGAGKDAAILKGKRVLIIDDVLTTGATASAIASVAYKCGASKVTVLAYAATPYHKNNAEVSDDKDKMV